MFFKRDRPLREVRITGLNYSVGLRSEAGESFEYLIDQALISIQLFKKIEESVLFEDTSLDIMEE